MTVIDFLRDVGKNFRLGTMLAKDTVARRLNSEDGISFTEFSYQVLQGNDYLHLFDEYHCTLQLGGNDQWGNLTSGLDLIHKVRGVDVNVFTSPIITDAQGKKFGNCTLQLGGNDQWGNLTSGLDLIHKVRGVDVNVFTSPIITDAQGKKFGKSEGNAVWIDGTMLSPYRFYQFWFNRPDVEMESLLKAFTFLPKAEIERLVEESRTNPGAREAQRTLAWEVTSFVHGEAATQAAIDASAALFGRGGDLASIDEATLEAAAQRTLAWEVTSFVHGEAATQAAIDASAALFGRGGDLASIDEATLEAALDGLKVENEDGSKDFARVAVGDRVAEAGVRAGLFKSISEARKTIRSGGVYLNNVRVDDEEQVLGESDLLQGRFTLIRRGLIRRGKKALGVVAAR